MRFHICFLIALTLIEFLKVILINTVAVLTMSKKLATPDLHKIKVFSNKVYDITDYVYDVTNSFLSK